MHKIIFLSFILQIAAFTASFSQYKPLVYHFTKGQSATVEISLETNLFLKTGKIRISIDSIDDRGGTHVSIMPSEYGDYLEGLKFNAVLTPRGQLRVSPSKSPDEQQIMNKIKNDSSYRSIWGGESTMMVYQFLFPFLPRPDNVAAALDTVQNAGYTQRAIVTEDDSDAMTEAVDIHRARTTYKRSKSYILRGVKIYKLTRTEEESEEDCMQRNVYNFTNGASNYIWTVRESDGAILRERMITYKKTSKGDWKGITRDFCVDEFPD